MDTTTDDLENFKKGNISEQLRYDWTHFNCYGYYSKGIGVYKKGVELGYWSQNFTRTIHEYDYTFYMKWLI